MSLLKRELEAERNGRRWNRAGESEEERQAAAATSHNTD